MLISLLEFCKELGVKKGAGDLESIEGFSLETLRTGLSMKLWMYLVDPKNHILNVLCHYLDFWLVTKISHTHKLMHTG